MYCFPASHSSQTLAISCVVVGIYSVCIVVVLICFNLVVDVFDQAAIGVFLGFIGSKMNLDFFGKHFICV